MIIIEIIYNLAIIVAVSVVSGFVDKRFDRKSNLGKILQGIVFGFIAILAMFNPYQLTPGIFFDGRSIILSLGALFFGNITGIISGVMAVAVRLIIGGDGAFVGSSVIMSSVIVGLLFNFLKKHDYLVINNITLYLLGILVHLVMLFLMFFLPKNFVWITFRTIAVTVLLAYPFVTILIGKILNDQAENTELIRELKESEAKHKSIVENSFDVIFTMTTTGFFTYVSPSWEIKLGHKQEEVLGRHFSEYVHPEDLNRCEHFVLKILTNLKIEEGIEYRVKHKDGYWRWHSTSAVPITDKEGNTIGIEGIAKDITDNKKIKLELEYSEEKLNYFIQNSPMAVIEWDSDERISRWTGEAEKIFGFTEKEVLGKNAEELKLIYEKDINTVKNDHSLLVTGVKNYIVTVNRNYTKDRKIIFCEWYNTVRKDYKGKILYSLSQVLEVTERINAEKALAENRTRLNDIVTFLPDPTFAIDKNKRIILWNKAMEEMTGFTAAEMIGKQDREYAIPFYGEKRPVLLDLIFSDDEEIKSKYKEILKKGDSFTTSIFCPSLYKNKGAWLYSKASPLYNSEGEIIGAIESMRDITYQKMQEETEIKRLEQLTLQQEILIETATSEYLNKGDIKLLYQFLTERIGNYLKAERTSIWLFNDEFSKLECINLYELSKKTHTKGDILEYDEFKNEFEALKRSKFVDASYPYQDPRTKGYVDKYFSKLNITSMLDSVIRFSDKLLGVICVEHVGIKHIWSSEEISFLCQLADQIAIAISNHQRKIVEKNLKKLSMAVEQSQISIVITNKDAIIEYVNPKFLEISGYTIDEVMGKNPNMLSSDYFGKNDYAKMWELLIAGEKWNGIFRNKKKNGELYWESATITPLKNEDGVITNYVAVKEDITLKQEMETNLKKALEHAEEMNRLKSNFLANMNHEIRTPLNGMLGFAEILTMELNNPIHKNMAATILYSGKRLGETLNLILDLSTIESQNVELDKKRTEVITTVEKIALSFRETIENKGIRLKFDSKLKSCFSELDEHFFVRAVHNIIDNAVKYTEKGEINIEVGILLEDDIKYIFINIKDTGIGIPEDKIPVIWQAFRQVSEGLNRGYEGTGLGLTIAKKIIELMHGSIEVKSKLGQGTEFIVKIPYLDELESQSNETEKNNISNLLPEEVFEKRVINKKLLYVEDDEINRSVVKIFLKKLFDVFTAEDAQKAIEIINKEKFDVILMDINLGVGLNGLDLTKEIRKSELYKNTPIIAVTAYTADIDKEEFIKAGCTNYIIKPFNRNTLIANLKEVLLKTE